MNNDLISFLESKGASNEYINKILSYAIKDDSEEFLNDLKKRYDILYFSGLNSGQIEEYLFNNPSYINCNINEFIKGAWIFKFIDYSDMLFSAKSFIRYLGNYKKIFMRYLVLTKSNIPIDSPSVLLNSPGRVYFMDHFRTFNDCIYKMFGIEVSNDYELEDCLNKSLIVKGKKYTVDEMINFLSYKFYSDYLNKKQNKKEKGKAI